MAFTLKDSLQLIHDLLVVCHDIGNAALEKNTDLAGCGAMFLARGAQCVDSVALLAQHGLNGDAMSVARTVTELAIDYPYIALDPVVRLKKFRQWDHIAKYRLAVATAELHNGAFDADLMKTLKELHDKAVENYARDARPSRRSQMRPPRPPRNWAGESIQRRADVVAEAATGGVEWERLRRRMYTLPYADMCDASHSCYGTLRYAFDGSGDDQELVFGRMQPDLKPADLAFRSMLILTNDVLTINDLHASLVERFNVIAARRYAEQLA